MNPSAPPRLAPRARGWTLRRRVGTAFSGLALLLAVLLAAIFVSLADVIDKADALVNRWQPAVSASQELLADVASEDGAVRGYALSAEADFLRRYHDYRASEASSVASLRSMVHGREDLQAKLTAFQQASSTWRTQTAKRLIALVAAQDPSAPSDVNSAANNANFTQVRTRARALTSALEQVSKQAEHRRREAATVLTIALIIAAVLLVAVGVAVWRGLHRWVLAPVDSLAAGTREVAAGAVDHVITSDGPPELVNLANDTETMRRRMAEELERVEQARAELVAQGEELARSNSDLEQFAYVASHDLSEPLRKVTNFCQLLERQYADQLDEKARQYIDFAVDGAKRMQTLINELLAFSRVGRTTERFVPVDTGEALNRAIANLEEVIGEAGARIERGPLPTVPGDEPLLVALLQNLISNAVKYRSQEPPQITISAQRDGDLWAFTVADNGIGIDAQYSDRIFAIFQRLHLRGEYSGTGIGLAVCRRIVEFHGGRIWLDTAALRGATFRFTLADGSL